MTVNAETNRRLADHIKSVITLNAESGVIENGVNLYNDPVMLAEGVTPDALNDAQKLVKHHDTTFVAATARAVTELAREAYSNDDFKADAVVGTFPMYGKDSLTVAPARDGAVNLSITNRAVDTSVGQLKIAVK